MGIPRLTSYIAPYAVTTVLGCDKPRCQQHSPLVVGRSNKVIVDGPALVYAIYDRLTVQEVDHVNVLAAVPTYDEVGQAALAFLSELEKCSIIMYDQIVLCPPPSSASDRTCSD